MNGSSPSCATRDPAREFQAADRPQIALITNHGYPSVDFPVGGAPDTGGQIVYVNSLARALDTLGFKVTIFARGGFPYFESDQIRDEPEYLTPHARYIFVPGGGSEFIRKEEIAVALDEEVDWLDRFVRAEARAAGCQPWELYEIVNTHYWDAAVIGMRLVERWRDDIAAEILTRVLGGIIDDKQLARLEDDRHWNALGAAPEVHLGMQLLDAFSAGSATLPETIDRAADELAGHLGLDRNALRDQVAAAAHRALDLSGADSAPPIRPLIAAEAFGRALLEQLGNLAAPLRQAMTAADRHVWTPHSLGSIKEENFKERDAQVVQALRFCERRSHERSVCHGTRMFVATSTEIAAHLRIQYGVPTERIFYFPPCVDRHIFRTYVDEELDATYRYLADVSGLEPEKLRRSRIVFETSRMDQTKRKDVILEAYAQAASPDSYLFIGGGPRNQIFESLETLRNADPVLRERAFLTDFIPEEHIGPLFAIASIYVSASEMEGFGMSALQGAASGCALVSSDLTPFAVQYVPDAACLVAAGDVGGFAAAMSRLLEDDDERQRRAETLVALVRELDWEGQAGRFLDSLRRRGFAIQNGRV